MRTSRGPGVGAARSSNSILPMAVITAVFMLVAPCGAQTIKEDRPVLVARSSSILSKWCSYASLGAWCLRGLVLLCFPGLCECAEENRWWLTTADSVLVINNGIR